MPRISITNNGTSQSGISDPRSQLAKTLPASETTTFDVDDATLERLESQLDELRARVDDEGDPIFVIDVTEVVTAGGPAEYGGVTALTRWLSNRVSMGTNVTNPSTASTVSARRVDIVAGEAYVDGQFFVVAASEDEVGDAEILVDGTDVSEVDLSTDQDVYTHVLLVNNDGALETVLVRGEEADAGEAEALTADALATAVGNYLELDGAYYGYVEIASILFEEDSGLTQTTTRVRPAPPNYA